MITAKMIRVLIVDDSDVARGILRTLLEEQQDIEVVAEARSGREAIEMAQQHMPSLILMDIVMDVMDGFTATKRISRDPKTKNIPIVMMTSKSQQSDIFRAKTLGARGYLVKPANEKTLMETIRPLL